MMVGEMIAERVSPAMRLRWLILLLFLPGICCVQIGFPGASERVTEISLVAFFSACLLLSQLRRPASETFWCIAILLVFLIGYYIKYYLYAMRLESGMFLIRQPELFWAGYEDFTDGLQASSIAFACFCLVSVVLLRQPSSPIPEAASIPIHNGARRELQRRLWILLALTLVLGLLASILPSLLGFGAMGVENPGLPFHLDAFITRFRLDLAPALLLLVLWLAEHHDFKPIAVAGTATLLLLALVDSVVRTSRGSLIEMAFPILLLWIFTRRMTRPRVALFGILAAVTVVTYPIISVQRSLRMQGDATQEQTLEASRAMLGSTDGIMIALDSLATRVSGLDGVLAVQHSILNSPGCSLLTCLHTDRLRMLLDNATLTEFQTYEVVGVSADRVEGRPPTLVGAALLMGGLDGILLIVPLVTIGAWWTWRRLRRNPAAPVLLAFFGSSLMNAVSEGNFGIQGPLCWLITCLIIERLYVRLIDTSVKVSITREYIPRLSLS